MRQESKTTRCLLILAFLSFWETSFTNARAESQPNILWIVAEDVSPWMPAFGDTTVATPAFDRMMEQGIVLTNAFAPNPICSPTRSSLMTGRYPTTDGTHHHRLSRDDQGRDAVFLPEWQKTLPELFQNNGYNTFNIGKDDYNFVYDRRSLYSHGPDAVDGHIGELIGPSFDWVSLAAEGPFFGQIQIDGGKTSKEIGNPTPPSDITLPPYYPDTQLFREYYARHYDAIKIADAEVAQILAQLEAAGLSDSTYVFFISDHGMLLLRHKQFLYDGGIHVPVFIMGPPGDERLRRFGQIRDELVSLIDLPATALDIAGIPIPDYMEGRSIVSQNYVPRSYVISSRDRADYTFDRIRSVRTERFKYIRNYFTDIPYMQAQYRDGWELTREYKSLHEEDILSEAEAALWSKTRPYEELYDLEADPHETVNLVEDPDFSSVKTRLAGLLDLWAEATGDKGLVEESDDAIGAVVSRWGARCIDHRCDRYRAEFGDGGESSVKGVIEGPRRDDQ